MDLFILAQIMDLFSIIKGSAGWHFKDCPSFLQPRLLDGILKIWVQAVTRSKWLYHAVRYPSLSFYRVNDITIVGEALVFCHLCHPSKQKQTKKNTKKQHNQFVDFVA